MARSLSLVVPMRNVGVTKVRPGYSQGVFIPLPIQFHSSMPRITKRTLVLMRDTSAVDQHIFVADLYSNDKVEDSVYLERDAMLDWVRPLAPKAELIAARAMSQLLSQPAYTMIDIPLVPHAGHGAQAASQQG